MAEIVIEKKKDVYIVTKTPKIVQPSIILKAKDSLKNSKFEIVIKQEKDIGVGNISLDNTLSNAIVETHNYIVNADNVPCNDPTYSSTDITKNIIVTDTNDDFHHKCPQCDRRFPFYSHLKSHYGRAHPNLPPLYTIDTSLICKICNKYIKCRTFYKAHCIRHAIQEKAKQKEKAYACDLCDQSFVWRTSLCKHYHIHKCPLVYVCIICKKEFLEAKQLMKHFLTHTDQQLEKCVNCSNRKACVCKHYKCGICKQIFNTKYDLQIHYTTHVKNEHFNCDEQLQDKLDFKQQAHVHVNKKTLNCQVCKKNFRSLSQFQAHSCMCIEKPFQCEVCKKRFIHRGNLNKHSIIHNNDRPHVCSVCDKGFKRLATLQSHYFTHGILPK